MAHDKVLEKVIRERLQREVELMLGDLAELDKKLRDKARPDSLSTQIRPITAAAVRFVELVGELKGLVGEQDAFGPRAPAPDRPLVPEKLHGSGPFACPSLGAGFQTPMDKALGREPDPGLGQSVGDHDRLIAEENRKAAIQAKVDHMWPPGRGK